MKGLSYYYSLSPLMWLNFLFIKIGETVGIFNPTTIHFWPTNQLIMAMIRAIITFVVTFYLFKILHFKRSTNMIATILYGMSTVVIYFNFTWSFYGNFIIFITIIDSWFGKIFSTTQNRYIHCCDSLNTI